MHKMPSFRVDFSKIQSHLCNCIIKLTPCQISRPGTRYSSLHRWTRWRWLNAFETTIATGEQCKTLPLKPIYNDLVFSCEINYAVTC